MITKKNDFCVVYDDFSTIHAAFIFLLITVFYSEVPDNVISQETFAEENQ